jgi:hypothetical protein
VPFNVGPVELLLFSWLVLSPLAGFWIWWAKRQRRRWAGVVVGLAVGWMVLVGWIILVLIAALWKPAPEVD